MASECSSAGATGEASNGSTPPEPRVSYCDFISTAGLHPAEQTFDEGVIKNLDPELYELYSGRSSTRPLLEEDEEERLKTFLRIRPSSRPSDAEACLEVKDEHTVVAYASRKHILNNVPKKHVEFKFSRVLGPTCGQSTVFEECVTPMIEKFMRNENCLIFSYGATNSGKTYTMQGHGTDYGVIPRTLDVIFSRYSDRHYVQANIRPHLYQSFHYLSPQEVESLVEKRERIMADANIKGELMNSYRLTTSAFSDRSGVTVDFVGARQHDPTLSSQVYSVWVSYAELYNERVYDLLDNLSLGKNKRRKELKLLQDRNGFVYIKDLTELPVTSDEQAYQLFLAGRKNLQFAATQMNQNSSRSHSFFTIRVVSIGIENATPYPKTVHRMTFCDLAGMERANQTENRGFRLQESGNINNSLTVLLKVIRLLREKQTNLPAHGMIETVPFRESKLTHIFKSYFTSATHICMVVNVNPDPAVADSTLQVLHNSAIASNVIVFRPVELNVQAIPYNGNGTSNTTPKLVSSKPPLPPKNTSRKPAQEIPTTSDSSMESETESDDYQVPTVVAPKTYLQKLRRLEQENAFLRQRIIDMQAEHEAEKERIISETMSTFAEERKNWRARLDKVRLVEENHSRRRLSLVKLEVSPRNSCGNCGPPVQDMDSIDETVEEEDEETTENIPVGTENSCKQNGIKKSKIDVDSDKEN